MQELSEVFDKRTDSSGLSKRINITQDIEAAERLFTAINEKIFGDPKKAHNKSIFALGQDLNIQEIISDQN